MRIIHNEQAKGDGTEVLDISASLFFVYGLVGIGATSFVALSKMLKSFLTNVDHTKVPEQGRQERAGKLSLFSALDHCASISHPTGCSQEGVNM